MSQIFLNGQLCHGGDRNIFEVMNSNLQKGTLGSVASLLVATLDQQNPVRNHRLWNIISTETYKWKVHNGKIEIISFDVVSFLTAPHCQFRGVGECMVLRALCFRKNMSKITSISVYVVICQAIHTIMDSVIKFNFENPIFMKTVSS